MFWTIAGPVIGILGLIASVITGAIRWFRTRRVLACQLAEVVPVLDRAKFGLNAAAPVLTIRLKGIGKLNNPHFVQIRLTNRGYRDISSAAFDQGRPLVIDLGVPVVALLDTVYQPPDRLLPAVVINNNFLNIGPALIRRRSAVTFYLLADGNVKRLQYENPLIQVRFQYSHLQPESPPTGIPVKKIIGWAAVVFIVFYLVTNPRGAVQAMVSLTEALKQAGASLAAFLNYL